MTTRTSPWPTGTPCWLDVTSPDPARCRAFYGQVLGWSFDDPDAAMGGYAYARVAGRAVAGVPAPAPGAATGWTLYLATDDLDATCAAVAAHGGQVLAGPHDVATQGRFAVCQDPTGARVGFWQAGTFVGTEVAGEPGALGWEDLRSTEPARAQAFYAAVLGVELRPLAMAGPDYATFHLPGDDAPLGGMGGMFGATGDSHWLVYIAVSDVDGAAATAAGAGGSVITEPFDSPYGRMAGIADPDGSALWLVAPTGPQPDRNG